MPLFFMLSGYVHGMRPIQMGKQNFFQQFRKIFMALYVPCLFFSYLQAVLNLIAFSSSNPANVHIPDLQNFLMIPFKGFLNYWFLCSLFFIRSIHLFFECIVGNKYLHSALWLIVFILAGFSGDGVLHTVASQLQFGFYFHAGYIVSAKNYVSREKNPGVFCGTLLLSAGLIFFFMIDCVAENKFFMRAASASCMSLSLLIFFYALSIRNKFLSLCGVYSMVIYCVHNYPVMIFRILYKCAGLHGLYVLPYITCFVIALFMQRVF